VKVKGAKALVQLSCPAGGAACAGTAKLSAGVRPKWRARSRPAGRRIALGGGHFSIAVGTQRTVTVKLTKKGLALFRGVSSAGLAARLEGAGLDPRAVVLKRAAPRGHRHHRSKGAS
jgi:hypothetical protein